MDSIECLNSIPNDEFNEHKYVSDYQSNYYKSAHFSSNPQPYKDTPVNAVITNSNN